MERKPDFKTTKGGIYWENTYDDFSVKVFMPDNNLLSDVINYCFMTPYVMVLEEKPQTIEEAVAFAEKEELDTVMKKYAGGVVFFYPTCEGGWKNAPADLFTKIIDESRIGQYNENGCVNSFNFIKKIPERYYIRGAVHRSFLYGCGEAADYIAKNCLKKIDGNFLWGPGEITPVVCTMKGASVLPEVERTDMVVVSCCNSDEFNNALSGVEHLLIDDKGTFGSQFSFTEHFFRIMGGLNCDPDLTKEGMIIEPSFEVIPTSPDNKGDDRDTKEHKIGYIAYCDRKVLSAATANGKKLPTLLAFHGGGDSAMIIAQFSSGWALTAKKYGFLLICVENHINSTATETVALIEKLKEKYPIDPERIYASGFSMGGIKSWDMYQEKPTYFAAVAPMSATVEPGMNVYFSKSPVLNESVPLPVFYVGGEQSPLAELAKHEVKCYNRLLHVLKTNGCTRVSKIDYNNRDTWEDPIWALKGDTTIRLSSNQKKGRVMTLELFSGKDGRVITVFGSINDQQHEIHRHQCEYAWNFMSNFRRLADGTLLGGDKEEIISSLS